MWFGRAACITCQTVWRHICTLCMIVDEALMRHWWGIGEALVRHWWGIGEAYLYIAHIRSKWLKCLYIWLECLYIWLKCLYIWLVWRWYYISPKQSCCDGIATVCAGYIHSFPNFPHVWRKIKTILLLWRRNHYYLPLTEESAFCAATICAGLLHSLSCYTLS